VPNKREKRRLIRYGGNDDDHDEVANKCVFVDTDRYYKRTTRLSATSPSTPPPSVLRRKKKMIVAKSGMEKKSDRCTGVTYICLFGAANTSPCCQCPYISTIWG